MIKGRNTAHPRAKKPTGQAKPWLVAPTLPGLPIFGIFEGTVLVLGGLLDKGRAQRVCNFHNKALL